MLLFQLPLAMCVKSELDKSLPPTHVKFNTTTTLLGRSHLLLYCEVCFKAEKQKVTSSVALSLYEGNLFLSNRAL